MHGIVLLQGLKFGRLPEQLRGFVEREYRHYLGGSHGMVDICRLRLDRVMAPSVAFTLTTALLPERYYARLNDTELMYVAYPTCVVRVIRSKPETADIARRVGSIYSVLDAHMRFEEMFDLDHPEMHELPNAR